MRNAIVLLSGGLDSSTTLAIVKEKGYNPCCISFDYGQKQLIELEFAKKVKEVLAPEAKHMIVKIDLKIFGKSAITSDIDVPKHRTEEEILSGIPVTYVPARNTIFLSYALAYAEVLPANDIFIGANILDYSGYPDCRPAYIEAYNVLANLALSRAVQGEKMTIHTPLMQLNKTQIIQEGLKNSFIESQSAIQCCIIPGNKKVKLIAEKFQTSGFDVKAILSPTVPIGQERLRFCLHSYNSEEEISEVLKLLTTFVSI